MPDNAPPALPSARSVSDKLAEDFAPLLSLEEFETFRAGLPQLATQFAVVLKTGTFGRSALKDFIGGSAGEPLAACQHSPLELLLDSVDDLARFCESQVPILRALQARLFVAGNDLVVQAGKPSVFDELEPGSEEPGRA